MNSFLVLLSAFITVASTTAPPTEVKTIPDVVKTCIYLSAQDVPLPRMCESYIRELNHCSNEARPRPLCYGLIGSKPPTGDKKSVTRD